MWTGPYIGLIAVIGLISAIGLIIVDSIAMGLIIVIASPYGIILGHFLPSCQANCTHQIGCGR